MNIDTTVLTGSSHTVCEDNACCDVDIGSGVLSDGCSGSKDTCVGSMILSRLVLKYLKEGKFPEDYMGEILVDALSIVRHIGTSIRSLDATVSVISPKEVFMWGDGFVGLKFPDKIVVSELRYEMKNVGKSLPLYPSYGLKENTENFNKYGKIISDSENNELYEEVKTTYNLDGEIIDSISQTMMFQGKYNDPFSPHLMIIPGDVECAVITSDGFGSFIAPGPDMSQIKMEGHEALFRFLSTIKNYNGVFIHRWWKVFMRNLLKEQRWHHTDDVSIVGLHNE
mgnify:CR=1 FL=1